MRMRTYSIPAFILCLTAMLQGQTALKSIQDDPQNTGPAVFQPAPGLPPLSRAARAAKTWEPSTLPSVYPAHDAIKSSRITTSGSRWIELHHNDLWASRSSLKEVILTLVNVPEPNLPVEFDWEYAGELIDEQQITHIRTQQTLGGIPVYGQDLVLHIKDGRLRDLNGYVWTGKCPAKLPVPVAENEALNAASAFLVEKGVTFAESIVPDGITLPESNAHLLWYPVAGSLKLVYEVHMHPNMLDHWKLFVDASTREVTDAFSQLCRLVPLQLYESRQLSGDETHNSSGYEAGSSLRFDNAQPATPAEPLADGPTMISDQDLFGTNRTVHAYQVGSSFYMIDASRPGMFQGNQSVMPNEPVGVIWTIDARNSSPSQSNFQVFHVTNANNNWQNLEVSAHYNGGVAYEYFRQKFNRNSINGSGGNIVSIINVRDENGNNMDNAFWNGTAMFYGNGDVAFNSPLAKALDVAGHEMSHGVIQNTANLEYVGQSGALNESFADVFGAMIDRDDWKLGEDVVNINVFPTGAMRDLSNPNNGGTNLNHPGWQPKHMNEYQNLPNTPEGDNGGVHVNSGIPNRAFFLLATSIGKDKAEQIYYKALRDYLVKSSQFIDARNAVEKAAADLHGASSAEVTAVRSAFDAVGIGAGQGGQYEEDIDVNNGADFILATDANESDLYWVPPSNPNQFVKMDVPAPLSRPSFTDDGTACVYVDKQQRMILINFDWSSGLDYEAFFLENNPQTIWRNVVVSKDGSKIAYTTSNLRKEISVFDFNSNFNNVYQLYNPTTAQGGFSTGDVLYADAMEWDYSGDYIMYDALNRIPGNFGNGIEYWDIGFLHAWNTSANQFGSGQIGKLFSAIPENISIGNPSFAKNSPYIIVFDFLENYYNIFGQPEADYRVKAANIEAGHVNDIYLNNTIGYPSYSRLDNKILFTYDDFGAPLLATINVQPANKTLPVQGTDVVLIEGGQKAVWFTVGDRNFTSVDALPQRPGALYLWPQPAQDRMTVSGEGMDKAAMYTIFDMTGKIQVHGPMPSDGAVPTGSLVPGSYLLRIDGKDGFRANARFIKQ